MERSGSDGMGGRAQIAGTDLRDTRSSARMGGVFDALRAVLVDRNGVECPRILRSDRFACEQEVGGTWLV